MSTTTDLYIAGIGAYLPERETAAEAIAAGRYSAEAAAADEVASVCVERALAPAEMAASAGRDALQMAAEQPGEVRSVLHAYLDEQGARFWDAAPYVALHTVGSDVPALDIRQSCNGALAGIDLGRRFINGPADQVLITAADRFDHPWVNRWAGDQSVFGDGAGAAVLSGAGGFARVLSLVTRACNRLEGETRAGWQFGADVYGTMDFEKCREHFHQHSMPLMDYYRAVMTTVGGSVNQALQEAETRPEDLRWIVPVTTTRWRMQAQLEHFLGLGLDRCTWEFGRTTGHMGAADQLTGLHHLHSTGRLTPGDRVLLLGGGTGFTMTAVVLEIQDL